MKIDTIELHNGSSVTAVLSFKDPSRAMSYNVKTMTGLDADAIVPRYYGASKTTGQNFYNLAPVKRDIVMDIGLNPNFGTGESYSDLRDDLYRMISSSRFGIVEIQFKNGPDIVAVVEGLVSKMEALLFEKSPAVQITFTSDDSMLKAWTPTFMGIPIGLDLSNFVVSDTNSTAPHGFDFQLNFTAAIASLVVSDPTDTSWSFTVTPVGGFLNGDVLNYSSEPTNKQLYITRGASTIYLGDVIAAGSMWPILFPGDNHLSFSDPTHKTLASLSYFPTYWGV